MRGRALTHAFLQQILSEHQLHTRHRTGYIARSVLTLMLRVLTSHSLSAHTTKVVSPSEFTVGQEIAVYDASTHLDPTGPTQSIDKAATIILIFQVRKLSLERRSGVFRPKDFSEHIRGFLGG